MESDIYKTIAKPSEGFFKEKGSKFIALAVPISTEEEVKQQLLRIRKDHHGARHHCYAYVIGTSNSIFRSNDDGEPSGTAGKPILNQIYTFGLTNILVVVVRYFGGIKLGVSGLINAYKKASQQALSEAKIETKTINHVYGITFSHAKMNQVMRVLKEENLQPMNTKFELDCYLEIQCRKKITNKIESKFNELFEVRLSFIRTI